MGLISNMLLHKAPLFHIYFGNAHDNLNPQEYLTFPAGYTFDGHAAYARVYKALQLEQLLFLHQTHSVEGFQITPENAVHFQPFKHDGDFLITDLHHVGLGVVTADCLPIVFYDTRHQAVGIAHAGWRGSVQSVGIKTLEAMQRAYKTQLAEVQVYFGPSAQVCCYRVGDDFATSLESFSYADRTLQQRDNGLFFDLPLFNRLQLEAYGVKREGIALQYNICTICDENFCSYRRDGMQSKRQMTVVSLK